MLTCLVQTDSFQILVRLSSPALNIKQIITDYKTCPLDSAEEKRLQEEVKMWKDYEADVDRLKEEMKKVHTGVTGVKKEVEAKFTGVEKKRQDAGRIYFLISIHNICDFLS
jgi:Fe-S cluster assembly ATPase SufC